MLNINSTVTDELILKRLMDVWIDRAAVRTNTFRCLCILTFHDSSLSIENLF